MVRNAFGDLAGRDGSLFSAVIGFTIIGHTRSANNGYSPDDVLPVLIRLFRT